ncbi:hypothetical protein [Streptomyces sp. NPDC088789]|uniref:SCO2583 family membrane protein n=1 Tax=Streptomyces sp. NPDC088789 TaxID=3365899 RepID=UPI003801D60B
MGGPGDPPEGTPDGAPGGADDEYRSVVFDESFIRAARLQEFSAQERLDDHAPAVRRLPPMRRGLSRQALILVMLIAMAFGTAIYMGVRTPAPGRGTTAPVPLQPLRTTVVPLAPRGAVPGTTDTRALYEASPAAEYGTGAEGIPLPASRPTANFSDSQVSTALITAKDYLVRSSLYPEVLTGGEIRPVRVMLDPDQLDQFDQSFEHPAADGRYASTGWLVRFDPGAVELADHRIRVRGNLQITETDSATLEVVSDHVFVYALRPAGAGADAEASLFTVRRELRFLFDHDDLRLNQAHLRHSDLRAGPLSCTDSAADRLRPLLAGQAPEPGVPADTDPYDPTDPAALCGTLAAGALPKV